MRKAAAPEGLEGLEDLEDPEDPVPRVVVPAVQGAVPVPVRRVRQ